MVSEDMVDVETVAISLLVLTLCVGGIYTTIWGRNKRILFSRAFCYKKKGLELVSEDDFCSNIIFNNERIPREYILAKRWEISDYYLDFPPECLHPDMIWEEIPRIPSVRSDIEAFVYYLLSLGVIPKDVICGKTIAQIIVEMYRIEKVIIFSRNIDEPYWWRNEFRKIRRQINKGLLPKDSLEKISVADLLIKLWEVRTERISYTSISSANRG